MRNLIALITLFLITFSPLWSQIPNCDCKTDLDFIVENLKKHHLTRSKLKVINYLSLRKLITPLFLN